MYLINYSQYLCPAINIIEIRMSDDEELLKEIERDNVSEIKKILRDNPKLSDWIGGGYANDFGGNLIHEAAHSGSVNAARVLYEEYKVDIDKQDYSLLTPLHVALRELFGEDQSEIQESLSFEDRELKFYPIIEFLIEENIKLDRANNLLGTDKSRLNIEDFDGRTIRDMANQHEWGGEMELLIEKYTNQVSSNHNMPENIDILS